MAISSLLVPIVAVTTWGAGGLIVLRIICGLGAVKENINFESVLRIEAEILAKYNCLITYHYLH